MKLVNIGTVMRMLLLDDMVDGFADCALSTELIRSVCGEASYAVCVRYADCVPMAVFYPSHIYDDDVVRMTGDEDVHGGLVVTGYEEDVGPRGLTGFEESLLRSRLELRRVGGRTTLALTGVTKRPRPMTVG